MGWGLLLRGLLGWAGKHIVPILAVIAFASWSGYMWHLGANHVKAEFEKDRVAQFEAQQKLDEKRKELAQREAELAREMVRSAKQQIEETRSDTKQKLHELVPDDVACHIDDDTARVLNSIR
jgi:hypothetical protein